MPPYVGPRGWVGVRLDRNLEWRRIAALVREAYEHVAPTALSARIGKAPAIKAPRPLSRSDIDPLASARGKRMIEIMRGICLKFPETREAAQFDVGDYLQAGRWQPVFGGAAIDVAEGERLHASVPAHDAQVYLLDAVARRADLVAELTRLMQERGHPER